MKQDNIQHPLFSKSMVIDMPDGFTYKVPVELIARNHAQYYAENFNGDITKTLLEDTIPLFEDDDYEIRDWASNNMNWSEVKPYAKVVKTEVPEDDFQDAWVNGEYKIE